MKKYTLLCTNSCCPTIEVDNDQDFVTISDTDPKYDGSASFPIPTFKDLTDKIDSGTPFDTGNVLFDGSNVSLLNKNLPAITKAQWLELAAYV